MVIVFVARAYWSPVKQAVHHWSNEESGSEPLCTELTCVQEETFFQYSSEKLTGCQAIQFRDHKREQKRTMASISLSIFPFHPHSLLISDRLSLFL
jgi:hypothetical protein